MNSTLSRTVTRLTAGALLATGLALGGSLGMADIAHADTRTSNTSGSETRSSNNDSGSKTTDSKTATKHTSTNKTTTNRNRQNQAGLNGNPPPRPTSGRVDQFKHLPFNPAQPGGD